MLRFAINECRYNVPQGAQGQIDFGGFLQPITGGAGFGLSFRSSQINQVELTLSDAVVVRSHLLDAYRENAMRARAGLVHESRSDYPVFRANTEKLFTFVYVVHGVGSQTRDNDAFVWHLLQA